MTECRFTITTFDLTKPYRTRQPQRSQELMFEEKTSGLR